MPEIGNEKTLDAKDWKDLQQSELEAKKKYWRMSTSQIKFQSCLLPVLWPGSSQSIFRTFGEGRLIFLPIFRLGSSPLPALMFL